MELMILCKVVDNYGDIGFVYRLARALSELDKDMHLSLVVSDLPSFAFMAPGIDEMAARQSYNGWDVLDGNNAAVCKEYCAVHAPKIILECFQCGRPAWLEDILFDKSQEQSKKNVQILNIEYLTAESWADDFHLLKSGTRSAFVKKVNFMPGFTSKTAGLILDKPFTDYLAHKETALQQLRATLPDFTADEYNIVVFAYKKDFSPFVSALQQFSKSNAEHNKVHVYVAAGISQSVFMQAYEANSCSFTCTQLPRLYQTSWDALLTMCDLNLIRGEDSFSRACLAGIPFVWHAYQQDGEYQIEKLYATLCRMKGFFSNENYSLLTRLSILYNLHPGCQIGTEAQEIIAEHFPQALQNKENAEWLNRQSEAYFYEFFAKAGTLKKSFADFSASLISNGDFALHLHDYLKGHCYTL